MYKYIEIVTLHNSFDIIQLEKCETFSRTTNGLWNNLRWES